MKTGLVIKVVLAACLILGVIVTSAAGDKKPVATKNADAIPVPEPVTEKVQRTTAAGYEIPWQVISNGGGRATSAGYILNGTIGQMAVGKGTSASYTLSSGYWQIFESGGSCCTVAGDADDNGVFNISDAVYIVNRVFKGGPTPPCCDAADANGDGVFNISDGVHIINRVFKGGPPPVCGSAGNGPCP